MRVCVSHSGLGCPDCRWRSVPCLGITISHIVAKTYVALGKLWLEVRKNPSDLIYGDYITRRFLHILPRPIIDDPSPWYLLIAVYIHLHFGNWNPEQSTKPAKDCLLLNRRGSQYLPKKVLEKSSDEIHSSVIPLQVSYCWKSIHWKSIWFTLRGA